MTHTLLPTQANPGWRQFTANQWGDLKEDTSGWEKKCTAMVENNL